MTGRSSMRDLIALALAVLLIAASPAKSIAEEVTIEHLGLEISANLELGSGKSIKSEGMVLLVHDTLGHGKMELMAALQDGLHDQGLNSLAITLGLGVDKRHGMFDCGL